jgi:membrane protein implicated in regulation of membrane protease activity
MSTPQIANTGFLFLGLLLIFLELVLGIEAAFDLVIIGIAIFIGGGIGYFADSTVIGIVAITIQVLLYFLLGRKYLQKKLRVQEHPSNVDALIGEEVEVVSWESASKEGIVKINGEEWRAKKLSKDVNLEDTLYVSSVEGVKVIVKNGQGASGIESA